MSFNVGFPCDANDTYLPHSKVRADRLNESEQRFLRAHPFGQLGIPLLLFLSYIPVVSKSSVKHIYDRVMMVMPCDIVRWVQIVCAECIDERDPDDIREKAKAYLADPISSLHHVKSIFTHWLLDRFEGADSNQEPKTRAQWLRDHATIDDIKKSDFNLFSREVKDFWAEQEQANKEAAS